MNATTTHKTGRIGSSHVVTFETTPLGYFLADCTCGWCAGDGTAEVVEAEGRRHVAESPDTTD